MPGWSWLRAIRGAAGREAAPRPYEHLVPGWRYRTIRRFTDHDGIAHPIGETWTFLRADVLPYEDGLSLFVTDAAGAPAQIRLQRAAAAEGAVTNALHDYLAPQAATPGRHALLLTRDSVCLADDVAAPHAAPIEVARDADACAVARAVLDAGYLAWTSSATWTLALGEDRVALGWTALRRFVTAIDPPPLRARAERFDAVHLFYHAQAGRDAVIEQLRATPGRIAR